MAVWEIRPALRAGWGFPFFEKLLQTPYYFMMEVIKMAITASMVKDLRTKTGAGMMDCKKSTRRS